MAANEKLDRRATEKKGPRLMNPVVVLKRVCLMVTLALVLFVAGASAAVAAPQIRVSMLAPDHVTPGKTMAMWVNVINVGDEPLAGSLTVRYTFPDGMTVADPLPDNSPGVACVPSGQVDECVIDVTGVPLGRTLTYQTFSDVDAGATGTLIGQVEVSGGGASNAVTVPLSFDTAPIGPFGIDSMEVAFVDNPVWQPRQAGSVPREVDTAAEVRSEAIANFNFPSLTVVSPTESFRDVVAHVPAGMVGYPPSTPARCTSAQLQQPSPSAQVPACPRDSQIGLALVNGKDTVPVYNLFAPHGAPAMFGFYYQGLIVNLKARVRPSDYGIDIVTNKAPSSVPISKFEVQLWGVPADSSHDTVRADCTFGVFGANGTLCPTDAPRVAFLRTPTSCAGPLPWSVDINSYQHPDFFHHAATASPAMTGCELNPFNPTLSLAPSTLAPHAPAGVDTTVSMAQDFGPNGLAPADIRRVNVALPEGLSINPSSADGLQACTDAQLRLHQDGPATCPDASKLGTVTVNTPLLDHPIGGSVFLRTQNSDDPTSGELFRIAIEVRSDDDGIAIRLPGALRADPSTGQLTATFDTLPQLPFDSMDLHFKTGPRAPLATPSTCGMHTTNVEFTGWNDKVANTSSSFETTGCEAPRFAPTLRAGVENPTAGESSPLHVRLTRSDDDGEFASVSIDTPKGLLGRIKDADQCTSTVAETGDCPAGSLIGHATVGAGVGSNPFFLDTGRVYLTGPYKGAPYGLAVVVDAIAGPFDLGRVVVRQAIHVDPTTAQLRVVSDSFPTILKGVPLRIRTVRVAVDKPGFIVSPTSCTEKKVAATVQSTTGAKADVSSRFQVGDCSRLAFTPRLGLRLTGRKQTRTGKHPGVRAVVRQAKGQANIGRAAVTLPSALALDPANARALCEYEDGTKPDLEDHCPKGSVVGRARAKTPLLDHPLAGDVYFVKNIRIDKNTGNKIRTLPMLIVALRGEIAINLKGTSNVRGGRLVNTFNQVPDAPVTQFNLNINGGNNGILVVTDSARGPLNICAARQTANIKMAGQNAKRANFRVHVKTPCKKR